MSSCVHLWLARDINGTYRCASHSLTRPPIIGCGWTGTDDDLDQLPPLYRFICTGRQTGKASHRALP